MTISEPKVSGSLSAWHKQNIGEFQYNLYLIFKYFIWIQCKFLNIIQFDSNVNQERGSFDGLIVRQGHLNIIILC